jgi:hypothetical protein
MNTTIQTKINNSNKEIQYIKNATIPTHNMTIFIAGKSVKRVRYTKTCQKRTQAIKQNEIYMANILH